MNKPTIAKVLHYAADHCLNTGLRSYEPLLVRQQKEKFSCYAIDKAIQKLNPIPYELFETKAHNIRQHRQNLTADIISGLIDLGLKPGSFKQFVGFATLHERQAARYNWLKFAALLAEEQGV